VVFVENDYMIVGIDRVYHPRMAKEGRSEKLNEIKPDEY
jgi:hypothetical protein